MQLYELTVKYERAGEKGLNTKVTEQYIIKAHSCATAEVGLLNVLKPLVTGICEVLSVKRSAVSEVIGDNYGLISKTIGEVDRLMGNTNANTEADRYYKAKVQFEHLDEITGKLKKTNQLYFIYAGSVEAAHKTLNYSLQKSISDYEIQSVVETKFINYAILVEEEK